MDEVATNISAWLEENPDQDPEALAEFKKRIVKAAAAGDLITYSRLIDGVDVLIEGVRRPFAEDLSAWTPPERNMMTEFLCRVSADSYLEGGFMASAVVVHANTQRPSTGFFKWAKQVGAIPDTRRATCADFFAAQRRAAKRFYS